MPEMAAVLANTVRPWLAKPSRAPERHGLTKRACAARPGGRTASAGREASLEAVALGHHDDAALGDGEAARLVRLQVEAHLRVGRHAHALVDDGVLHLRVAADVHLVEDDRALHAGVAVHARAAEEDALAHHAAGDDAAA